MPLKEVITPNGYHSLILKAPLNLAEDLAELQWGDDYFFHVGIGKKEDENIIYFGRGHVGEFLSAIHQEEGGPFTIYTGNLSAPMKHIETLIMETGWLGQGETLRLAGSILDNIDENLLGNMIMVYPSTTMRPTFIYRKDTKKFTLQTITA
jgi:hypothetical protein